MTELTWLRIVAEAVSESNDFREFFTALDKKRAALEKGNRI